MWRAVVDRWKTPHAYWTAGMVVYTAAVGLLSSALACIISGFLVPGVVLLGSGITLAVVLSVLYWRRPPGLLVEDRPWLFSLFVFKDGKVRLDVPEPAECTPPKIAEILRHLANEMEGRD